MQAIKTIKSRTTVLPFSDIDTDQIIPARFLTTTSKEGLGKHVFHDWRYDQEGNINGDFALNQPGSKDCEILVAGHNFGCGSSREHAPWALLDFGLKAVISTEIADIFRSNALKNGLLPIVVGGGVHDWLLHHPGEEIEIDLESTTLTLPDGERHPFPIDAFARYCLLQGIDQLGYLQSQEKAIAAFEKARL